MYISVFRSSVMDVGAGEKTHSWAKSALCKLQNTSEDCLSVSLGFFVLGRTPSHAASPTPPSVPSVVEPATSPLTANTPGDHLKQATKHGVKVQFGYELCFCNNVCCFASCSTFAAHRATGGEPPQSAQDKARMDKEYLSLMAELGEAPVPTSGGGHSNNQGGGPRSSGLNNNQPPPVSLGNI